MKTVYYNGKVYTGDLGMQEAFIVEDGRFSMVGRDPDVKSAAAPGDRLVDLQGAFVLAGFNDSHMHLLSYGNMLTSAQLAEHTGSLREMISHLRAFAKNVHSGWIRGRGWNQDCFTDVGRMPDRFDLDSVSEELPIMITRACGHCAVFNSKALSLAGIDEHTPDPEGGRIEKENGTLSGRLYDNAIDLVRQMIPVPTKEEIKEQLVLAAKELNRNGVTSCQTDDYGVYAGLPWQVVNEAYRELEAEGRLTVRVTEQANFSDVKSLTEFIEAGNVTGAGSDLFRIGPLKMLGDGALGARTAYLSVPYADDPSTYGIPVFSEQQFTDMFDCAVRNKMQIAVHAIGDRCLDRVLNAYEAVFQKYHPVDHRCGIVHCQITRPEQLRRIAELGLHVYAQTIFLDYDIRIVEARVGKELADSSYRWKTLMDLGATLSNGSDCPVELSRPLSGIQCAVTRKTLHGDGPYLPEEAFTVREAVDSFTKASAYASFEEEKKGQIRPGMAADFTVLGSDLFQCPPDEISAIRVIGTYLGGKQVF